MSAERSVKRQRLRTLMTERGIDALVLTSPTMLGWYLDGARTHVSLAAGPLVQVRVGADADEVWLTDNEAGRLLAEELPGDVVVHGRSWFEPVPTIDGVTEQDLARELWQVRFPLLPQETRRFADLGADTATALTTVLGSAEPDWTERRLAGEVSRATVDLGADPLVVLVGGESRRHLPHPLPTDEPLGRRVLVVLCARRYGLIANLSRIVVFGKVGAAERDRQSAILEVEATAFEASVPGAHLNQVLAAMARAYADGGFGAEHWRGHHQGGMAGYDGRDPRATPATDHRIGTGQAFAWNPWAPGFKVEDTVVLEPEGIRVLTVDPAWPTTTIAGRERPDVLIR